MLFGTRLSENTTIVVVPHCYNKSRKEVAQVQTISSMSMSPKDSATVDATDQEKVEIQAPVAPDSAVVDNVAADTEAEDDTTKDNNKQHKMTVAADAPWSARMVRIQTSYVLFGLYFV